MSLVGTVANYGGKQPNNTQNIKQFVIGLGSSSSSSWIIKKLPSGLKVQTPLNNKIPLYINNDLYVTGSIYNTSDLLLKDNILVLSENKTNNILKLNSVEFVYKSDLKKTKHLGFLAQEVEKIFPELVKNDIMGYKSVNYFELIPIIVSKMKTMQNEIDDLKKTIENLTHDNK
jgi:hypothetical protein